MNAFLSDFELGEIVYLKTDTEQTRRMVAGVEFCLSGATLYRLIAGTIESCHGAGEMSRERELVPEGVPS